MHKLLKQAFTLIELLVVIAIIGILSGLIVVAMGGMTDKATLAKAQVFSNSLRNSLMLNLVSDWNFDGSGVTDGGAATSSYLQDMWGQKNGTVTASPPTILSGSNCIYGSCFNFNGSQYVSIPNDAVFNFGTQMTAMVWVKGGAQSNLSFFGQWDDGANQRGWMMDVRSGSTNQLRVWFSSTGANYIGADSNSVVFNNKWHLLGFTQNNGIIKIYVDGALDSTNDLSSTMTSIYNSNTNLTIGSRLNNGSPSALFAGQIDEARLYNKSIPVSQIKEQYYAGLNNLLAKGGITKEEYQNRIGELAIGL